MKIPICNNEFPRKNKILSIHKIKFPQYFLPLYCVKGVRIRSYSGPRSVRIQSECGKMRTRITPNTNTFYAVLT